MFAILGMFLISFASAVTYKIDQELDYQIVCENAGYCSSTASCNATIWNPLGEQIISNEGFTNNGYYHNITIPDTSLSEAGTYIVSGFCEDGSAIAQIDKEFEITLNGNSFTTSQSIIYFVLLFAISIFFFVSVFAFIKIPFKNERNEDGKVISVNDLKYFKVLFFFLAYGLLTWMANIMIEVSSSLLNSSATYGFFSMLFKVMTASLYPMMILALIAIIVLYISDSKLYKWLDRGISR